MNDEIRFEVAEFNSVWNRVTNARTEQRIRPRSNGYSDVTTLRCLIADEAHNSAFYSQLARMCSSSSRAAINGMAADARCHMKKLSVEYYLLTGEYYTPVECAPLIESRCNALRLAYASEIEGYSRYIKESECTKNADLADMYRNFAEDDLRHAKAIRKLVGQNLF